VESREEDAVQDPLREEARVVPDFDVVLPLEDLRNDRRRPVETVSTNGVSAMMVTITASVRKMTREIRKEKRGRCTATVWLRASVAI